MANNILSDKTLNKIANVLDNHAQQFVDLAKENLRNKNAVASGDLVDSITFKTEIFNQRVEVTISMLEYARWVDEGRGPGGFPPVDAIKKWIRNKGIVARDNSLQQGQRSLQQRQNTLAYLIGRKIARQGTPAQNFIPEFDLQQIIEDIQTEVSDDIAKDIKVELTKGSNIYS